MKARPILFSGEMVRALLEGRKTQTRRIVDDWQRPTQKDNGDWVAIAQRHPRYGFAISGKTESECASELSLHGVCRYGKSGDYLWVREGFGYEVRTVGTTPHEQIVYRASKPDAVRCYDCNGMESPMKWKPSIHMPRWASRLTLRITDVRVERLQEISEADAWAEGSQDIEGHGHPSTHDRSWEDARDWYADLWESINGPESWQANPWVWVIQFEVIQANVDSVIQKAA